MKGEKTKGISRKDSERARTLLKSSRGHDEDCKCKSKLERVKTETRRGVRDQPLGYQSSWGRLTEILNRLRGEDGDDDDDDDVDDGDDDDDIDDGKRRQRGQR